LLEYFTKILLLSFALQGAAVPTAMKTTVAPAPAAINEVERGLLWKVSELHLADRQLGNIATQRAANQNIRAFARRMMEDHSAANDELVKLAAQKGVTLPTALNQGHQKLRQRLSKLSGSAFDRAFMGAMVTDHRKNMRTLRRLAHASQDEDVQEYAEKTLETIGQHQKQAKDIRARLSIGVGAG
jgi:putative membrane protein